MQLLGKMLGDPNKKELNIIQPIIDKINTTFVPNIKKLSDEELAAKTKEDDQKIYARNLRERIAQTRSGQ